MMGADYFEEEAPNHYIKSDVHMGIGAGCTIEHCIIDKNARIGDNVIIRRQDPGIDLDGAFYYIRDGITVIPKNAIIPPGAVI